MRLLKLTDDGEITVTSDLINPPPYAIFSHTWGSANDEVSWQDFASGREKSKLGHAKIMFCAQQAKNDGLQYIWVDTCCINRASNSELTEAMNSMFSWYRNAEKCYVLLSDVTIRNGSELIPGSDLDHAFRHCRWFTRGWTLQELIAPGTVEFYSREGELLGTKETLAKQIHEITGVPLSLLLGAPLSGFSVTERLAWADERQTTRAEDGAYCLLGILDVHIPLIYGEGSENAYVRLQAEIDGHIQRDGIKGEMESLDQEEPSSSGGGRKTIESTMSSRQHILEMLAFDQMDFRYHNIKPADHQTCAWMLETSEWRDWMQPGNQSQHHSLFCIKGKPGSGKSTMVKYLLTHLKMIPSSTIVISFFFNARGTDTEKNLEGMCRTLLYQLLKQIPELQDQMSEDADLDESTATDWLLRSIEYIAKHMKRQSLICLIDAVDECSTPGMPAVVALLEGLADSAANHQFWMRTCWSSRHYPSATIEHSITLVLDHQEGHAQDIEYYTDRQLEILDDIEFQEIKNEIKDEIRQSSGGIFLWVVLVIAELKREFDEGASITTIMQTLRHTPKELDGLFGAILDRETGYHDNDVNGCGSHMPHSSEKFDLLPSAPETDSGYMSRIHGNFTLLQNSRISHFAESPAMSGVAQESQYIDQEGSDDTMTVYSDTSSIDTSHKDNYMSELADALASKVLSVQPDDQAMERILEMLPDLLKEFALKIGYGDSSRERLDIMHFVHKHSAITENFKTSCLRNEDDDGKKEADLTDKFPLGDIMNHWYTKCEASDREDEDYASREAEDEPEELDEEEEEDVSAGQSTLHMYRDMIFNLPSYEWLLRTLQRESFMSPAEPNEMAAIRQQIISVLTVSRSVSRNRPSQSFDIVFHTEWDPLAFITQQRYQGLPSEVVRNAITLTGTARNAQALTSVQYMRQTWPFSGHYLIDLVQRTLESDPGCANTCDLPDSTHLSSWIDDTKLVVEVEGTASAVADTGEQVAWLGAALRASSRETGISFCTPCINQIPVVTSSLTSKIPSTLKHHLAITFTESGGEEPLESSNGQCWHSLFRNPTIVRGFPIPRRHNKESGLEIPLHMMAGLARTQHVDKFNGKVFIKGFSTMLIPTNLTEDVLSWHLVYNKDGERISYLDFDGVHAENMTFGDLENARHILGWCSDVKYNAGAVDANYDIHESGLRRSHSNCRLMDVNVSRGKLIKGGEPYVLGNKDEPFHIIQDDYKAKILWIHKKNVVLWDVQDQRGWLINGSSALLHLLRAALRANEDDELSSQFIFKPGSLKESRAPYTARSAIEVLLDHDNQKLGVYLDDEGENITRDYATSTTKGTEVVKSYNRLLYKIECIYSILEKLIDYQVDMSRRNKDFSRRDIRGWDFTDLATNEDPMYLRNLKLGTCGKGWVDFVRSIHAVVLFGSGYGEILRPSVMDNSCPYWNKLPSKKFYLGVSMSDLSRIVKRDGRRARSPMRLTESLVWYHHKGVFIPCDCVNEQQTIHSDLVQSIFPARFVTKLDPTNHVQLQEQGAIIFGQNSDLGYFYGDSGEPQQGTPPPSPENSEDDLHDSALGSSINRSTASGSNHSRRHNITPAVSALKQKHYKIGIVCALPKELLAVRALFDIEHPVLKTPNQDDTIYAFGSLCGHNVVAACLPCNDYGNNSAASVASHMLRSFRALKYCFLVGIGGGVPSYENDVRLGDVVVSTSVIQHDLGKIVQNADFKRTGIIQRPPRFLMKVIGEMMSNPRLSYSPLQDYTKAIENVRPDYIHPGQEHDRLFRADFTHDPTQSTCEQCDGPRVSRNPRQSSGPQVFYGPIASGNQVVKDATLRDRVNAASPVLCFEMEAAGVMTTDKFLVIRGICDYADSHKSDGWQKYAAASAAAYTKFFLSHLYPLDVAERTIPQNEMIETTSRRRAMSTSQDVSPSRSKRQRHAVETELV